MPAALRYVRAVRTVEVPSHRPQNRLQVDRRTTQSRGFCMRTVAQGRARVLLPTRRDVFAWGWKDPAAVGLWLSVCLSCGHETRGEVLLSSRRRAAVTGLVGARRAGA